MYIFKEEKLEEIKDRYKLRSLSEKVGICTSLMSQIMNGHRTCPKPTAYCIVKMIDKDAEIEDYFNLAK